MAAGCAKGKLKGMKVLGTRRTRGKDADLEAGIKRRRIAKNKEETGIKIAGGQMTEEVRV